MTQTQVRRVQAQQLASDDDLAAAGIIDEGEVELHTLGDFEPGDTLFESGDGRDNITRIRVTESTSPGDQVVIYRIDGRPSIMSREMALLRLEKRYPRRHALAGKRVFYRRPPVERPEPEIACDVADCNEGRSKRFYTEQQKFDHVKNRHPETYAARERKREESLAERQIRAAERQADLMERVLASGAPVPATVAAAPEAEPEAEAEDNNGDGSRGPLPDGEPTAEWKPGQVRRWMTKRSLRLPDGHESMSAADLVAYLDALKE